MQPRNNKRRPRAEHAKRALPSRREGRAHARSHDGCTLDEDRFLSYLLQATQPQRPVRDIGSQSGLDTAFELHPTHGPARRGRYGAGWPLGQREVVSEKP